MVESGASRRIGHRRPKLNVDALDLAFEQKWCRVGNAASDTNERPHASSDFWPAGTDPIQHAKGRDTFGGRMPVPRLGEPMRRRQFITLLGGAAAAWPLAARAQQGERMRRIGVLIGVSGADGQARATALAQGLGALNWHEGRNLRIDWRWAGGDTTLYERYAAELVSLHPDVLLAQGSLPITLLRRHTNTIPIVFSIVADPLGQGFVESLARPGGNITGFQQL